MKNSRNIGLNQFAFGLTLIWVWLHIEGRLSFRMDFLNSVTLKVLFFNLIFLNEYSWKNILWICNSYDDESQLLKWVVLLIWNSSQENCNNFSKKEVHNKVHQTLWIHEVYCKLIAICLAEVICQLLVIFLISKVHD